MHNKKYAEARLVKKPSYQRASKDGDSKKIDFPEDENKCRVTTLSLH